MRLAKLQSSLGKHLENFCKSLLERGFSRETTRHHLSNLSHLSSIFAVPEPNAANGDGGGNQGIFRRVCLVLPQPWALGRTPASRPVLGEPFRRLPS